MIKKQLSIALVFILLISWTFALPRASSTIPAKEASDIDIRIDEKVWKPLETDGKPLVPIMINGRIYLPFRAVLERFGIGIDYNPTTKRLNLTTKPIADDSTKDMDKASPQIMKIIEATPDKPNQEVMYDLAALATIKLKGVEQSTSFELSEAPVIVITDSTGSAGKVSFKEFTVTKYTDVSKVRFVQDPATGVVKEVYLDRDAGSGQATGRRSSITIEVSGPPWKIKITIRF